MKRLMDMKESGELLAEGLEDNALRHLYYKLYTSMDTALEFLMNGYLQLSNGFTWNDTDDYRQMEKKRVYGKCFSWSTRENMAMWMLYGDRLGTNGAALNFPRSVLKSIKDVSVIEVVEIIDGELIGKREELRKEAGDFELYFTDIIYSEATQKDEAGRERESVTYNEKHEYIYKSILENEKVFRKQYEWKYENECRLVVKPLASGLAKISAWEESISEDEHKDKRGYITLRLKVPEYRKMKEENLIHSPIYKGKVIYGVQSKLHDKVKWDLK